MQEDFQAYLIAEKPSPRSSSGSALIIIPVSNGVIALIKQMYNHINTVSTIALLQKPTIIASIHERKEKYTHKTIAF